MKRYIWFLCAILFALAIVFNVRFVIASGSSMEPTYASGDVAICIRAFRAPAPGDVILFSKDGKLLLKRVAAVAGEIAAVDGTEYCYWESQYPDCGGTVPDGCLFVCGDNSLTSVDSRNQDFGLVPVSSVWGFPFAVF